MKKLIPLGIAVLAAITVSFSQENLDTQKKSAATLQFVSPATAQDMDASALVEKQIDDFANRLGITYGTADDKGRIFFYSIKTVNVHNPHFIQHRIAAFEKAYRFTADVRDNAK